MQTPVPLGERFGQFDEPWSPKLIARLNGYEITDDHSPVEPTA